MVFGSSKIEESINLRQTMGVKENKVLIQIGTHTGHNKNDDFGRIAEGFSPSKVILVEPNKELNDLILSSYAGIDNVFLENVAIVAEDIKGPVQLVYPKNNVNGVSINGCHYGSHNFSLIPMDDWGDDFEVLETPSMTFTELCKKHKVTNIHYLQIDAEGYDAEIIRNIDFAKVHIDIIKYEDWSFPESCYTRYADKLKWYGTYGMEQVKAYLTFLGYEVTKVGKHDMVAIYKRNKYLSDTLDDEKGVHARYASKAPEVIVEIGVCDGDTTRILLSNSSCSVYGIDPIVMDSKYPSSLGSIEKINKLRRDYTRFTFIKDYSYNVAKTWDKGIDYIFIDGDHAYDSVKQDFNDWLPHVKKGGFIAFHDSALFRGWAGWPDTSKFVGEILDDERLEYIKTSQSLTIFKKR